jgi:hypothetical protein
MLHLESWCCSACSCKGDWYSSTLTLLPCMLHIMWACLNAAQYSARVACKLYITAVQQHEPWVELQLSWPADVRGFLETAMSMHRHCYICNTDCHAEAVNPNCHAEAVNPGCHAEAVNPDCHAEAANPDCHAEAARLLLFGKSPATRVLRTTERMTSAVCSARLCRT